eukprot:XP_027311915.1 basic proline-rich protein isoform X2 [Anas platyrhynchos]
MAAMDARPGSRPIWPPAGAERAPAAAPEGKTPRVGPGGRGLSPGHAGMGEAEVTPMLQPATQRAARPKSSGASSQPPLREENPIHLQGKGLEPVSAPRPDPCGVPDPAPGCRSRPHTAFGATPGSAHPPPFCAPLPPARPKPSRPSCSANSLLLCPLPPRCPLSLLPAFTSLSPKTSPFLAPRLAKICLAAPRLPQQEGLSAGELFPDPKNTRTTAEDARGLGAEPENPLSRGDIKRAPRAVSGRGVCGHPAGEGGDGATPSPNPNPNPIPVPVPGPVPVPAGAAALPGLLRAGSGAGSGAGGAFPIPPPPALLPSLPPSLRGCPCRRDHGLLLPPPPRPPPPPPGRTW